MALRLGYSWRDAKGHWQGAGHPAPSEERAAWWALQSPVVSGLVRHASVTVVCDPERADYSEGSAVIWGWMVADGDEVYGVGVKQSLMSIGCGRDVARMLLGSRLDRGQVAKMDLVDLWRLRMIPEAWTNDGGRFWDAAMGTVHMVEARGSVPALVASHIADPERERWQPLSARSASERDAA